jgi:hypothetical protein
MMLIFCQWRKLLRTHVMPYLVTPCFAADRRAARDVAGLISFCVTTTCVRVEKK